MTGDFTRFAVQRVIDQANNVGLAVPTQVTQIVCGHSDFAGAIAYANLHPNDDDPTVPEDARWCCFGAAERGLADCTCWTPVYELEQAPPQPPTRLGDVEIRPELCGDCAFRPGSPERADEYTREALYALADKGTPFWCHDGMRRPLRWEHPLGMTVDGDPDDWTPPKVAGIPYRADGRPALLCAGWNARAVAQGSRS